MPKGVGYGKAMAGGAMTPMPAAGARPSAVRKGPAGPPKRVKAKRVAKKAAPKGKGMMRGKK